MPVHAFVRLLDEDVLAIPDPVNITADPFSLTFTLSGSFSTPGNVLTGMGSLFQRGDGGSPEAFVTLAEVSRIRGPGLMRKPIRATSLDSTGGYDEWIAGAKDADRSILTINFTQAGYSQLMTDFQQRAMRNYRIVIDDDGSTQLDFTARVIKLPLSMRGNDAIKMFDVIFKITGQVTLTL